MTREEICNSMTLQDAIQVFKDTNAYGTMDIAKSVILKALQEHQHYKDLAESYEKTINKLTKAIAEQQPNEDCISRQAVLEITAETGAMETQIRVKALPSVTPQPKEEPQPKVGHWIGDDGTTVYVNSEGNVTESRNKGEAVKCSECGEWLVGSDEYVCSGRFCPSCGMKMEEKK